MLRQRDRPRANSLPGLEHNSMQKDNPGLSTHRTPKFASNDTESSWGNGSMHHSAAQAAKNIRFPGEADKIQSCQRRVSRFGMVLDQLLEDSVGSWAIEIQTLNYTDRDLEAIEYAHGFTSTCTSLFGQMVNGTMCGNSHRALVHLPGFGSNELRINIDTCHQNGPSIPAIFTRLV